MGVVATHMLEGVWGSPAFCVRRGRMDGESLLAGDEMQLKCIQCTAPHPGLATQHPNQSAGARAPLCPSPSITSRHTLPLPSCLSTASLTLNVFVELQERGRPYVVVFCGVNGVGKSTNLAKIAYWLGQHNIKVTNKHHTVVHKCERGIEHKDGAGPTCTRSFAHAS